MRAASGSNYEECLNRVIKFVEKPEVAGYYTGMTGPDLRWRLHGYDHHYAGRRDGWAIADGLDERGALELEKYLCLKVRERQYRTTAAYIKYDDKDKPYFPSPGGDKTVAPYEKVHQALFGVARQILTAGLAPAGESGISSSDEDT